jgi:hypothetical protein
LTGTDADRVNRELRRLAREQHGHNTHALQVLYAIEGFLRRLSLSGYREQLVLKGAMLLAVLDARRTTRDADLSAHGISNDEPSVAAVVAEIATTTLPESDGIVFAPASVTTEAMREGANYPGVRAKLPAAIGVARVVVTLDFSFGDSGEVEEIRYPEILGGTGIVLRAYPIERILAEKIATMMERGELNTRDRDFADVWVLTRLQTIDAAGLRTALQAVAGHRWLPILPLSEALSELPDRQPSYDALRQRAAFSLAPPDQWTDLIADVVVFVDPFTQDDAEQLAIWDPETCQWT